MKSFNHVNAKSVKEAAKQLKAGKGRAVVIAGGTDLLGSLKDNILPDYPETVINLKTIAGLDYIKKDADGLRIGALARLADIAGSPDVKGDYPLLAEAAVAVATPAIRNTATLGGNLCQDVRCWYYRYPQQIGGRMVCARKGGDECFAESGDNRYHAIMDAGDCYAVCPSDTAIALTALDANMTISGSQGKRTVRVHDFYETLGNVLSLGEIVTEIRIPRPPKGAKQTFIKFRQRQAIDFAIVSVASVISQEDGICKDARKALGAVAPTPIRATGAEEAVKGKPLDAETAEEAGKAAVKGADPLEMNEYKLQITRALIKRAVCS